MLLALLTDIMRSEEAYFLLTGKIMTTMVGLLTIGSLLV